MKKFLLILSFVLAGLGFTFSQETPEQQANNLTKKLARELVLSGKQSKELNKMLVSSYKEADIVRQDLASPKEVRKQKLSVIYADRKANMNAIFTDEQKAKFEAYKQSRNSK